MLSMENRITSKQMLRDWIAYETNRYGNIKSLGFRIKMWLHLGENAILARFMVLLRKTEYYLNTDKKIRYLWNKLLYTKMRDRYSMHIPLNTCGRGLEIMHVGSILMNSRVTVGENCVFHIHTSLVAGGTNDAVPTLGNHVILSVGAVVLGDVVVADDIAIGANAVVNKSFVEPNIAIAGVPAKKISQHGALNWGKGARVVAKDR